YVNFLIYHMDTNTILIPKKESTFFTFGEACAFLENYTAQTNIVLILGKTTIDPDSNSYRQATFACEKQGKYNGKKDTYSTKRTGCQFSISLNYRKRNNEFAITQVCLKHNHIICPDARKFSINMRKLDQNELGMIENLHDSGLRTKDIYALLASIGSKYVLKHDVYNAVSRQRQQKLQGLSEIEMLLKTIQNDKNIIANQDGAFIQAIFWAYRSAVAEFAEAKDVLIIDAMYKTNRLLAIVWQQHQEHTQKFAYKMFLHQNRHIQDDKDTGLEKLRSMCSRFAYETYIKQQRDFVRSGEYGVLKRDDGIYDVVQIDDQIMKTYAVQIETPSTCTCLHLWHTRTPCQHIIIVYLLYLRTCVPQSKVHKHWHVLHTPKIDHVQDLVPQLAMQIFQELPQCHHNDLLNLMQDVSNQILENGKIPKLQDNSNNLQQSTFETTNADNIIDYKEIKIIEVKHKRDCPPNNRHIPDANENKFKKAKIDKKSDKGDTFLHLFGLELDLRIPQNAIHNPLGDGYCGFRSLAVAIFKEEKKWQDVKAVMKSQLTKWQHFYSNILGYNTDRLMNVLSYIQPECSQEYWFYSPKCAQIASDTFNVPVAIYGIDLMTSLLFLPFDQKPGRHKKPIILHWHGRDHIVFVKLKANRNVQNPPLNPQYISICHHLGFSEDWFSLFT
ncbi:17159_t:CDS:2, partial [Cetraspora pellucida]